MNAQRVHTMHILYAESLAVNVGPCRKRLYAYRNTYELHKIHAMILRVKTHGLNCKTTRFNGKSIRSACSIGKHAFFEGKPTRSDGKPTLSNGKSTWSNGEPTV